MIVAAVKASMIHAARLDLVPMTPEFLRASLDGDIASAAARIGTTLPGEWPEDREVLALRLRQLEADPALQPWLLRAMRLRGTGEMVGHIGFHTAPAAPYLQPWSPAGVEFGFSVFPRHRRNGYAREAALALMQWARDNHGVASFVVSISPANEASQALAAGLGFGRVGSHMDEVEGPEDILVLNNAPVT